MRRFVRKIQIETRPLRFDAPVLPDNTTVSEPSKKILYCRCAFAQVVPKAVKDEVLRNLTESEVSFECVSDLCEMSARKDDRLQSLLGDGEPVQIAACYPRAVKWLFHAASVPFPEDDSVEVLNMREESAETITKKLLES